ncbi:MAG TPA: CDP-alcohol phosphatidyltransferase family protein [Candidatus Acidoferrales bacterium]|nr:CDP-alcohol phosphatidyltransferase family protein [Candidatus Acidoferrales bacterium]
MGSLHHVSESETEDRDLKSGSSSPISGLNVEKRWTISNILSMSRILLLVPIVILILKQESGYRVTVLILMLIAAMTDFLDGFFARALDQVTDFGKLLDPIADKICVIAVAAALVLAGDIPLWYAALVALRDVLIVLGSSRIITKARVVVQSVWTGKLTVNFIAAYLILATLKVDWLLQVKSFFLYLSTLSIFVSLAVYFRVYRVHMVKKSP